MIGYRSSRKQLKEKSHTISTLAAEVANGLGFL